MCSEKFEITKQDMKYSKIITLYEQWLGFMRLTQNLIIEKRLPPWYKKLYNFISTDSF